MKSLLNKLGQVSRSHPIQPTRWPHYDLVYVHSNALSMTMRDTHCVTVGQNQAILLYPGTDFSGSSVGKKVTTISVHHFSLTKRQTAALPPNLRELLAPRTPQKDFVKFENVDIVDDVRRLLQWESKKQLTSHVFMLDTLLSLVIANLAAGQESGRSGSFAEKRVSMDEYLRKNIAKPITSAMLAKRAGLSVNYFRVQFSRCFGMTPGKYIIQMKMKEAARLLSETLLPIKCVAQQVGFTQPANFHRSFRSFHKTTPLSFRRQSIF